MTKRNARFAGALALAVLQAAACSSAPSVKTEAYAKLNNERTFEYDFATTWKAIESALSHYKVAERDPKDVDPLELPKLTQRTLETDWIYTQSNDKYEEYKVNGSPRKIYLQTRMKYDVIAKSVIGGTDVTVKTAEEVERLNADGTSAGYQKAQSDPAKQAEMLDKIGLALRSAAP